MRISDWSSDVCSSDLIEVQFARAAVIVETIGAIDILLDLDDHQSGTDGVDRSRRIVHEIARLGAPPVDHRLDAAVECRPPQCRGFALLPEPDVEFAIGNGREYQTGRAIV